MLEVLSFYIGVIHFWVHKEHNRDICAGLLWFPQISTFM